MPCRRYVVRGLVQGVFFRATTQETAQRLGLTGWVRNLRDGSVELVACGEPAKLDDLERWLWKGPPQARVQNVTATEMEMAAQVYTGFSVDFTY